MRKKMFCLFVVLVVAVSGSFGMIAYASYDNPNGNVFLPVVVGLPENGVGPQVIIYRNVVLSRTLETGEVIYLDVDYTYNESYNTITGVQSVTYSCYYSSISNISTIAISNHDSYAVITFGFYKNGFYETSFARFFATPLA